MSDHNYASGDMLKLPNLRRVRQLHLWSLRQLSEESGVSVNTLSRIENGGMAQYETIGKITKALGVEVQDLVGGE
jgi:transcriptional regulator with XRE-family HTH domain